MSSHSLESSALQHTAPSWLCRESCGELSDRGTHQLAILNGIFEAAAQQARCDFYEAEADARKQEQTR